MESETLLQLPAQRKKNSYSTTFVFKYQLGLLSAKEKRAIPGSTRHDWKHRDLSPVVGFDPDELFMASAETLYDISRLPHLMKFNEAVLQVIDFYKSAIEQLRGHKRFWKKQKDSILQLIEAIKSDMGLAKACELLRISTQQFYRWKKATLCPTSTFGTCRKFHPGLLTIDEQNTIKAYVAKPENAFKYLIQIYYEMMKDGAAFMGKKTFEDYAKAFRKENRIPRKKKQRIGIRASAPFKLLHINTTILRTLDGTKVFIHFIVDNFSRVILGWKASTDSGSINPAQNLFAVCERYNLYNKEFDLLCDDGSENRGDVSVFLDRSDVLTKRIIAQVDICFSNSMVEAVNKSMKYLHLFPRKPGSFEDVIQILEKGVPEYNDSFPSFFYGLSRNDVLTGNIPDRHMYSEQILLARERRPAINRVQACAIC